ncbi:MAG: Tetratricopeptide 2 repeat-containing protein [Gemmatimonadetes bacterium]|nr:Tetratricopeptide 2 repeat-containing protein [Gemmatimonadota bacterium]
MEPTPDRTRALSAARAHLDRGFRFEQGGTLERALEAYADALAASAMPADKAEARLRIARVYRSRADFDKSIEEARAAVRLADEIGADDLAAEAMNIEVGVLQARGHFDEAEVIAHTAMQRATSPRVLGITLQNLGRGAAERGEFDTADRYFDDSIAAFREANYDLGLAVALTNAARSALDRGNALRSIEIGHEGILLARRLNVLDVLLTTVQNQAAAFVAIGNLESAEGLLTEALGHFTSARNPQRQAECLEIMGQMNEQRPDPDTAVRCYVRARDLATLADDRPLIDRLTKRIDEISASRSAAEDRAP